ncbi:MAG: hypothetical protein AAGH65_07385, partial [Pseudomonadota bacterium]
MLVKLCLVVVLILAALSLGFAGQQRPALTSCGDTLPDNVHFSIHMDAHWDARQTPVAGTISITLKDEISGETPQEIPSSATQLVDCIKAAIGVE